MPGPLAPSPHLFAGRDRRDLAAGRPPACLPEYRHERRNEDRAYEERVEEHAHRHRERELAKAP